MGRENEGLGNAMEEIKGMHVKYFCRCRMEYVDIFVVDLKTSVKAFERRLCGSTLPQPYISVYQQIEIVFGVRNKRQGSRRGFSGSFEFVEECRRF